MGIAFFLWVAIVVCLIVCTISLSALQSEKTAIGVVRFKPATPVELTNCITGDSFDLFPSLTNANSVGIASGLPYRPLTSGADNVYGPYCFENLHIFENRTITRITIPVYRIDTTSVADMNFTVYVISNKKGSFDIRQTHVLYMDESTANNYDSRIGIWATFDNLNIKVSEGETLAFSSSNDHLRTCYSVQSYEGRGFYGIGTQYSDNGQWWDLTNGYSLMFDVYSYGEQLVDGTSKEVLGENALQPLSKLSTSAPYVYENLYAFENKIITKLVVPVYSITTSAEKQFFTVKVVKAIKGRYDEVKRYRIEMTPEQVEEYTTSEDSVKWVMFSKLSINVDEGETVAFVDASDTITLGFLNASSTQGAHGFYELGTNYIDNNSWNDKTATASLLIDVYGDSQLALVTKTCAQTEYPDLKDSSQYSIPNGESSNPTIIYSGYIWRFDQTTAEALNGKVITKIVLPAYNIGSTDAYVNLHIIDDTLDRTDGDLQVSDVLRRTYKLQLSDAQNASFVGQQWITFDNLNIAVGNDETIAFGCGDLGTINIMYGDNILGFSERRMITPSLWSWGDGNPNSTLPVDIYIEKGNNSYTNLLQNDCAKELSDSQLALETGVYSELSVASNSAPYTYENTTLYENKTITKIVVPVYNVTNEANAFFTVSVVSILGNALSVIKSYSLFMSSAQISNWKKAKTSGNSNMQLAEWITFDSLNITVSAGQTLAFVGASDTVKLMYSVRNITSARGFKAWGSGTAYSSSNMLIDVYGYTENLVATTGALQGVCVENVFESDFLTGSNYVVLNIWNTEFKWKFIENNLSATLVTRIVLPVRGFKTNLMTDSTATFTIRVIDNNTEEIVKTISLTMSAEEISAFNTKFGSTGGWVTFDNLKIVIGLGQTLAFGSTTDSIETAYYNGVLSSVLGIKSVTSGLSFNSINYPIGIYGKSLVEGKSLSVLGDSISTYRGYNNNTDYNSTIGSNAVAYPNILTSLNVNDTWWMQTVEQLGMNLCVNNSWSGSKALGTSASSACNIRCVNLHNDNTLKQPDVIAVFMGTNDFCQSGNHVEYKAVTDELFTNIENGTLTTPTSFDEAYALMIYKMKQKYDAYGTTIFCFTLHDAGFINYETNQNYQDGTTAESFNDIIRAVAEHYGLPVVDIYNDSGINSDTATTYTIDRCHPNAVGMDLITECFINAMIQYYSQEYAESV